MPLGSLDNAPQEMFPTITDQSCLTFFCQIPPPLFRGTGDKINVNCAAHNIRPRWIHAIENTFHLFKKRMPITTHVSEIFISSSFCISYVCIAQICSRISVVIRKLGKSLASFFCSPIVVVILITRGIQSNGNDLEMWLRYITKKGNRQTFINYLIVASLTSLRSDDIFQSSF